MREELVNFIYDSLYQYKDNNHNGNFYYLSNPIPQEFTNNSGLYFFFDSEIPAGENKFKIVRVGITGDNGNDRLNLHKNHTINVSIFRKHIGRALHQLNGQFNENQISDYIQKLPYLYIPINEKLKLFEETCIQILSNRNQNEIIYPANENWLGFQFGGDVNIAIPESQMWNVHYTNGNDFNNFQFEHYQNILNQLFNLNIMNINCLNSKIATANGVLQPIILQSIKDIYLKGNHQMTARMVKNQCIIIDNNIQWNGKPAAICNAMRNAIKCGGRIVGEDRDFLDFTIAFDGNNLEISTPKKTSPKAETNKKEKTNSSSIPPYINEIEIEKLNLSKNFKVVMACAGRKNISFFTSYPRENFVDSPINNSEHHPDDTMNKEEISWRKYLLNNQNDINLKQAFELYLPIRYPNVYVDLYTKFNANFYILSAGWGLINSEFRLPEYNITFSENNNILPNYRRNKNLTIQPIYNDFNQLVVNDEDDIVLLGGKDYRNLFYKLTQHTPNRKVIFYKEQITPQLPRFVINRQTFIFVKYTPDNPNNNHDWYYELGTRI